MSRTPILFLCGAIILSSCCVSPSDLGLQRVATASPRPDPPTRTPTATATVTLTATRTVTPTTTLKANATPTRTRTPISQQLVPPIQTKPPVATAKPTASPTRQPTSGAVGCCKTCGPNSKACGDSCISLSYNCTKPPGCA